MLKRGSHCVKWQVFHHIILKSPVRFFAILCLSLHEILLYQTLELRSDQDVHLAKLSTRNFGINRHKTRVYFHHQSYKYSTLDIFQVMGMKF